MSLLLTNVESELSSGLLLAGSDVGSYTSAGQPPPLQGDTSEQVVKQIKTHGTSFRGKTIHT